MANVRVRAAAEYVGLSKSSLDKLRIYGGGPEFSKIGRAVVYSTLDLDAWLAAKKISHTWRGANENIAARVAA